MKLYRIMYKLGDEWHHDYTGTYYYGTVGAARGAITQKRKRYWRKDQELKIQEAEVGEWEDVDG